MELGERVSALEARLESLQTAVNAVGSLDRAQAVMERGMRDFDQDLLELRRSVAAIDGKIDAEKDERIKGQQKREREQKANRTLIVVAVIGFLGTFLSSMLAAAAVVFGG